MRSCFGFFSVLDVWHMIDWIIMLKA